jgi:orotate phosphoribosyltransferase
MKDRLVALLKERSVRFGEFTLKSGKTSDLYVDARTTTFHPEGAVLIANLILDRMRPDVVAVGGPATGAIPMAGAISALSFIRSRPVAGFMVRKEPKGHGTKQWLEGVHGLSPGAKVCVVEDTVTTGGSVLEAIGHIEDAGFEVVQCICVVDRREGAVQRFTEAGHVLEALVGREDLVG